MENKNTIVIGSDHGGFEMKEFIKSKLINSGYTVVDFGTNNEQSVDYPDIIHPLAKSINDGKYSIGIIMCGSGNGAQITANKYPNVRAGLCWNAEQAKLTKLHNNANIISLPGRFVSLNEGWEIVQAYLSTNFEGGRHAQRVNKISQILK